MTEKLNNQKSDVSRRQSIEIVPKQKSAQVTAELEYVAPVIAANIKIADRITLAELLKKGLFIYQPGAEVAAFLQGSSLEEIAFALPKLVVQKAKLEFYDG